MKKAFIILVAVLGFCSLGVHAQKQRSVYLFGVANQLNDTVVYMTEVQEIPDAQLQKRTGFLLGRAGYSAQLKENLAQQGQAHEVCVVYFSKNRKKIDKKYKKMKSEYERDESTELRHLTSQQFHFTSIGKVSDNRVRLNDPSTAEPEEGE